MASDYEAIDRSAGNATHTLVESACNEFSEAWHAGQEPKVERFLAQVPANVRNELLRRLLQMEFRLTVSNGRQPCMDHWLDRFHDRQSVVRDVWSQMQETRILGIDSTVPSAVTTSTRYTDLRYFRTGGMADLFLAHDTDLQRDTVVKRLREKYRDDPEFAKRLEVEAEITGRLDHPGVVPVFGIGEDLDGTPFYVMPMIRGRELQKAIDEYHTHGGPGGRGRESRQRLFDLLEHVIAAANTVAFAHDSGIVHGDLKPTNIMIGRYAETVVVDWGLARTFARTTEFRKAGDTQLVPRHRAPGEMGGFTPGYVSPEQFAGLDDVGPGSDIYSLGATLYQILTNRTPLRGSEPDFAERLAYGDFPRPRSIIPRISRPLEAICLKATQLSPSDRYQTGRHLAEDLKNWMHDEEVNAAPDRIAGRLQRWFRNHQAVAAAALFTLVALVTAVILISTNIHRRKIAEQRFEIALGTFEDLTGPLANLEKNRLDLFEPLAEQVVGFCDSFLNDRQLTTPDDLQVARLYDLRASANVVLDPNKSTLVRDLELAGAIYERLLEADPQDDNTAWLLACNDLMQGRVQVRYNDLENAKESLQRASKRFEKLRSLQTPPVKVSILRRRAAEAHHGLGELFLNLAKTTGDQAEFGRSARHFETSRSLRDRLLHDFGDTDRLTQATIRRDLARSDGYLGDLYLRQGDLAAAFDAYSNSLEVRKSLYLSNPSDPEHRFQYARGLANFANIEKIKRRDLQQAIQWLKDARELQEELDKDFKNEPDFRVDLGWTLVTLAELHLFLAADAETDGSRQESLVAARELARSAFVLFSTLDRTDPLALRGEALSAALLAEVLQELGIDSAEKQAERSIACLQALEPMTQHLDQDDSFTRALATAVLAQDDECFLALSIATEKGMNAAARWKAHSAFGLRSISNDAQYREEIQKNFEIVQNRISLHADD